MERTLGVLGDPDSGLVEVANLVLCFGVSMSGGLLVPISCHLRVLLHALSHEVVSRQHDLVTNRSSLRKRTNLRQIFGRSSISASRHGNPKRIHKQKSGGPKAVAVLPHGRHHDYLHDLNADFRIYWWP